MQLLPSLNRRDCQRKTSGQPFRSAQLTQDKAGRQDDFARPGARRAAAQAPRPSSRSTRNAHPVAPRSPAPCPAPAKPPSPKAHDSRLCASSVHAPCAALWSPWAVLGPFSPLVQLLQPNCLLWDAGSGRYSALLKPPCIWVSSKQPICGRCCSWRPSDHSPRLFPPRPAAAGGRWHHPHQWTPSYSCQPKHQCGGRLFLAS